MLARDYRFDGKFFVGVKTTGIYCRPICPAKPKRENVEFFKNHIEAERAGYRPCLRCHPESAPQSPIWIGKTAIVKRAIRALQGQEAITFDESKFAELFGVTARHLRRLFIEEVGKTPKQLFFENRLNLSRKLIVETNLPITEVAFASGFESIRRFNDAFKDRFKKTPSEIRRKKSSPKEGLKISVPYRPPFDFEGLMKTYENHRVGDLEWFEDGKMYRIVSFLKKVGLITISNDPVRSSLIVEIEFPDTSVIHMIISRVKYLFDLDSDPLVIANTLESDPKIKSLLKKYPGIRLPSGWDPFEVAISAILGQLVSVERGRSLVHDLINIAGEDSGVFVKEKQVKLFPTPKQIVDADLKNLKTTSVRKKTLKDFSMAILNKKLSLAPTQDIDQFINMIKSIHGIGPWTANYIALKALRNVDTFPESDLILARALEIYSQETIKKMSPWKGYVAALIWRNYSEQLKKNKKRVKNETTKKTI